MRKYKLTIEQYRDELELHFSDSRDAAAEMRLTKEDGPLLHIVAGIFDLILPEDKTQRMTGGKYMYPSSVEGGVLFDDAEITLSGFGKHSRIPGEKVDMPVKQKIAIQRKVEKQAIKTEQWRSYSDDEMKRLGL